MTKIASPPTVLGFHPGPESCDMCGAAGLKTELVRDPFIYGMGAGAVELTADVPVHTCSRCAVSYTGDEAEIARHEAVCHHLGVLTPAEIRSLRERYDMSRAAFARLTGLGEATLARWERGEVIQNIANDRYLRLLLDPGVVRRLSSLADGADVITPSPSAETCVAVGLVILTSQAEDRYRRRGMSWNPRRRMA